MSEAEDRKLLGYDDADDAVEEGRTSDEDKCKDDDAIVVVMTRLGQQHF